MTPKGILVAVSLEEKSSGDGWAECAVRKDAGDDYDVTNGILVYARAEFVKDKNFYQKVQMSHLESSESGAAGEKENPSLRLEDGSQQEKEKPDQQNSESSETLIEIDGGIGIGRVTKPGLDQPVGAAAINSVPRKMIRDAVYALWRKPGSSFRYRSQYQFLQAWRQQRRPSTRSSASRAGSLFSEQVESWSL